MEKTYFCDVCGKVVSGDLPDSTWDAGDCLCVGCHVERKAGEYASHRALFGELKHAVSVADRFLRRQASIGELRAAVRAAKGQTEYKPCPTPHQLCEECGPGEHRGYLCSYCHTEHDPEGPCPTE